MNVMCGQCTQKSFRENRRTRLGGSELSGSLVHLWGIRHDGVTVNGFCQGSEQSE